MHNNEVTRLHITQSIPALEYYSAVPAIPSRMKLHVHVPYNTYYEPMGDLPYISPEQGGGLRIHTELIYEYNASYTYTITLS